MYAVVPILNSLVWRSKALRLKFADRTAYRRHKLAADNIARRIKLQSPHHRERVRSVHRKWQCANHGRILERQRNVHAAAPTARKKRWQKWYGANREYNRQRADKWIAENKERVRATGRKRYWENPVASRQKRKHFRDANIEAARLRDRQRNTKPERKKAKRRYAINWKKNNHENWKICHRLYQGRRRQKIRSGTVTIAQWNEILEKHGHKCAFCGSTDKLEADHIIPLSRGGLHVAENLQPLCKPCNCKKNNKILSEAHNVRRS